MDGVDKPKLDAGRELFRQRAWSRAFDAFAALDAVALLDADDLECFALSAYLTGHDDDYLHALQRGHDAHVAAGRPLRAARCAFWVGLRLLFRGEMAHATGWLGRAERLVGDSSGGTCAERGYLLLPAVQQSLMANEPDAAYATAAEAVEIAERCGETDLLVCALHLQGRALIDKGETARGLAVLDEAMVTMAAGNLSPVVTGLVYCSVIEACQQVYAVSRAREWTLAFSQWCEEQPEMVAFSGTCLVHRAEIMQMHGAWTDALATAQRACDRNASVTNQRAAAAAHYRAGDVHRLRGEFEAAQEAFRAASRHGGDPQPGLALLRLAQGDTALAAKALRRALLAENRELERLRLLPACVEIMLAAGDVDAARDACEELERRAAQLDAQTVRAAALEARGALELAGGDASAALSVLRDCVATWQDLDAPYFAARARVLLGLACRALGDEDGMKLEMDAALATFERLEAAPDAARIVALVGRPSASRSHSLTRRELQVLRMLATGKTNRCIAKELFLSERTVDRHVGNILAKLSVPTRAAATAYAFRNALV